MDRIWAVEDGPRVYPSFRADADSGSASGWEVLSPPSGNSLVTEFLSRPASDIHVCTNLALASDSDSASPGYGAPLTAVGPWGARALLKRPRPATVAPITLNLRALQQRAQLAASSNLQRNRLRRCWELFDASGSCDPAEVLAILAALTGLECPSRPGVRIRPARLTASEDGLLRLICHAPLVGTGLNKEEILQLLFGDIASGSLERAATSLLSKLSGQDAPPEPRPPQPGDPARHRFMASRLSQELAAVDGRLARICRLSGFDPPDEHLQGRFCHGLFLRLPNDPAEFASINRAHLLGGADCGGRVIFQRDALLPTRFGQVRDPELFHAAVARMCTYQFAAAAGGFDPLTVDGMALGAATFEDLAPDARVFAQAAAVYGGNLGDGPGRLELPALARSLRGTRFFEWPGVGEQDLPTVGAITAALDRGLVSWSDLVAGGGIADAVEFQRALSHVLDGGFNLVLGRYDLLPYDDTGRCSISDAAVVDLYRSIEAHNPNRTRLTELKSHPIVAAYYGMFDLDGDGCVRGPETQAAVATVSSLIELWLSGSIPGRLAPAVVRDFFAAHDSDADGLYSLEQIRSLLAGLQPTLEAIELDQYAGSRTMGPAQREPTPEYFGEAALRCPYMSMLLARSPVEFVNESQHLSKGVKHQQQTCNK